MKKVKHKDRPENKTIGETVKLKLGRGAGDGIRTHDVLLGKQALYRWVTPAQSIAILAQRTIAVKSETQPAH